MVGFVVGLGDRHAENILFDSTTGDCVHVYFSCLFNKGESLAVPERVPFRLTRNMVDPMGVSGHEGGFTNLCAVTMNVLRGNRDSLMNVLETFAHDPLLEWARKEGNEGHRQLARCERRLRGEVTRFPNSRDISQVLSVDGQVSLLVVKSHVVPRAKASGESDVLKHRTRNWLNILTPPNRCVR
jgi:serine/threonine-protein kinase ATR